MSTSPVPSRRLNNLNGRSRSPSPAANSTPLINPQPHLTTAQVRNNFLSPEDSSLIRARRSVPTDPAIKEDTRTSENIPLIDAEKLNPPLANPETDEIDDDRQTATAPYPGVDDGFFITDRSNPDGQTVPENGTEPSGNGSVDDIDGRRIAGRPRPMSPTDTDFNGLKPPRFPDIELGVPTDLESIPDVNVYQHKKTLAQGMMDLALFSANANQLRYVVESSDHPYYYSGVVLISFSLILQVAIGVGLIWNARYNVKDEKEICIANKINNFTVIGIFLVTVVNVFISAFGVASTPTVAAASVVAPANP